jgi:release factor glutamine methyltransferase
VHFEPEQALFVSNQDPLQFYKAIADFSWKHLNDNGYLYFEVNSSYGAATQMMLNEKGYETELRNDIYGNVRMLRAQKRKTY